MNYRQQKQTQVSTKIDRTQILRICLFVFGAIIIGRLFYIQIIKHEYYQAQAIAEHLKKFEIPATRGKISLLDGSAQIPLVLNEQRYTLYADPKFVTDSKQASEKLVGLIGGKQEDIEKKLKTDSRYVVLAKKLTKDQVARIDKLNLKGIDAKEYSIRTYPQGNLAAQVLGFVNDENEGQYGIEGYLNKELAGKTGLQKAVTDVNGVPLAISNDTVAKPAEPGQDITLTIDIGMQRLLEDKLKQGVESTRAKKGTAILMEANTGAIKAMANFPTYDPGQFDKITDQSIFINTAVVGAYEPGSVMKPLLVGTAIDSGKVNKNFSYFDPGSIKIEDRTVTNAISYGAQTMTIYNILEKSLNTGVVRLMKQMGNGEITLEARQIWYKYLTERFQFAKNTNIEQDGEVSGGISKPDGDDGIDVRYANTAFGQGLTVTPLQMVAAYASLINGGTYYKPTLVHSYNTDGKEQVKKPEIVKQGTVSSETSNTLRDMLRSTLAINNKEAMRSGYVLGAKSGTAEVAGPNGQYYKDVYNGTYIGYIGGDSPKYILLVRLDNPKGDQFASRSAARVWDWISNGLIDNYAIPPKT